MNFNYIKEFLKTDGRFSYMHDIYKNEMVVELSNGQKFTITQEKYKLFKATYILFNSIASTRVSFIIFDEDSFKNSIETIYKLATVYDEQSEKTKTYEEDKMAEVNSILSDYKSIADFDYEEVIKYPKGGNMNFKNAGKLDLDFINDYKLMKSIERSVNDNLKVITDAFYKYTKVDSPATIIVDDNNKVFFFVEHENALELNFEFFVGGNLYSYSYTNRGIRLLDEYNKQAVMRLANLIERTVKVWLNKFSSKEDFIEVSDRVLSSAENIKVMIGLMARTIDIYNH